MTDGMVDASEVDLAGGALTSCVGAPTTGVVVSLVVVELAGMHDTKGRKPIAMVIKANFFVIFIGDLPIYCLSVYPRFSFDLHREPKRRLYAYTRPLNAPNDYVLDIY
jgi:hypothetical protein